MANINFNKHEGETLRHDEWNALGDEFDRLERKIEDSKGTEIEFPEDGDSTKFLNGAGAFSVPTLKPITVNQEVTVVEDPQDAKVEATETKEGITLSFSLPKGDKGDTGNAYVPSVDESGNLSFTNTPNSELPSELPSYPIKGPKGTGLTASSSKDGKITKVTISKDDTSGDTVETFDVADGDDAINPFKGWFVSLDALNNVIASPSIGDYAYITDNNTTYIQRCTTSGSWGTLSSEEFNPSNPIFASGENLSDVHIKEYPAILGNSSEKTAASARAVNNVYKEFFVAGDEKEYKDIISNSQVFNGYIAQNTFEYAGSSGNYRYTVIPLYGRCIIDVKANAAQSASILFLKTFTGHDSGNKADVAGGNNKTIIIPAGETDRLMAPSDANFLYVYLKNNSSVDMSPASLKITGEKYLDEKEETISATLTSSGFKVVPSVYSSGTYTDQWRSINIYVYKLKLYSKYRNTLLRVKANQSYDSYIVISNENEPTSQKNATFARGFNGTITIQHGTEIDIPIPGDTLYIQIYGGTTGTAVYKPDSVKLITYPRKITVEDVDNKISETVTEINGRIDDLFALRELEIETLCDVQKLEPNFDATPIVWKNNENLYSHWSLPVKEGEEYVIKARDNTTWRRVYFLSSNETPVGNETAPLVADANGIKVYYVDDQDNTDRPKEINITIPNGCNYLAVTRQKGVVTPVAPPYIYKKVLNIEESQYENKLSPTSVSQIAEDYVRPEIKGLSKIYDFDYISELADAIDNLITATEDNKTSRKDALKLVLRKIKYSVGADGWEIPQTIQQLNCRKKTEQLALLKWISKGNICQAETPSSDIPANTEFAYGIPYSSNAQDAKYIGLTVSVYTFLTAVNNPYSLMYTECVHKLGSGYTPKSAWGRKWVNDNGYSYYGNVCCSFTSLCVGDAYITNNGDFLSMSRDHNRYTQLTHPGQVFGGDIQIGDIFDYSMHSFIIYGIHRDDNGDIDKITIAESTRAIANGSGIRFVTFSSYNEFLNRILNVSGAEDGIRLPYSHYRYNKLNENIKYKAEETDPTQITYSNGIPSGTQPSVTYTNKICTFAGDKAAFKLGEIKDLIVLNYDLDGNSLGDNDRICLESSLYVVKNLTYFDGKYLSSNTGKITNTSNGTPKNGIFIANCEGASTIKFLAYKAKGNASNPVAYGFSSSSVDPNDIDTVLDTYQAYPNGASEDEAYELEVNVPSGKKWFVCTIRKYNNNVMSLKDFYCKIKHPDMLLSDANDTLTDVYDSVHSYSNLSQTDHAIILPTLESGKYKAYLSDGTTDDEDCTEFEVLNNTIYKVEDLGDRYKIYYSNPINFIAFGHIDSNNGDPRFVVDIKHTLTYWDKSEDGSLSLILFKEKMKEVLIDELYAKMHTIGEFGIAPVVVKVINN